MSETLSTEQQYAFDKFKRGENLFITGPGGTGKTLLIKHLVEYMKTKNISHQVCAMTGCASVLLNCGARTLHSWSGIKLARGPISKIVSSVLHNKKAVLAWKSVKVLIIDEVSMMSEKIFELIEMIARNARHSTQIFGGIQIIMTGDFFQLPPVGTPGEPESARFCFESSKWLQAFPSVNHIELKTMFRQSDPVYIKILSQIRKGEIDEESKAILKKYVKREYNMEENAGCIPTKLFPVRSRADFVNNSMYSNLEGDEYIFECIQKTDCKTYLDNNKIIEPIHIERCSQLTSEETNFELEQLINNTNISKSMALKKGSVVMCTFNIDVEQSICNGSQGVIVDFLGEGTSRMIPVVLFSNGVRRAMDIQYFQSEDYPTIAVGQIPLCLAWALTIHKIQGATLKMADMDLGNSVFEYGQTYVALSRIKSLDGLYLSAFHPHRIKSNPIVKEFYSRIPEITNYNVAGNIFDTFRYEEPVSTVKHIRL